MQQDPATDIPLVQTGFFSPVLNTLELADANIDPLLRMSPLNRFDLTNNENYAPAGLMYTLFEEVRRSEGIDKICPKLHPNKPRRPQS